MRIIDSLTKQSTTQGRRLSTSVHKLHTLRSTQYYQLDSCLSSIHGCYLPKTLLNKPSNSFLYRSSRLTPARDLTVTTDQFGRAQVWHTVGKQTGPSTNVVKASHPALGEDVTCISACLLAPA